jgi:hypothetical protein
MLAHYEAAGKLLGGHVLLRAVMVGLVFASRALERF